MTNPFNRTLDGALRGKKVRVKHHGETIIGWVDRIHHQRGSLVLHDCEKPDDDFYGPDNELGSVFIRTAEYIEVVDDVTPAISNWDLALLKNHPEHDGNFEPKDTIVRNCYRDGFAGSFPVVTTEGVIINGHKRVAAARRAGLNYHPCETISVSEQQSKELFEIAHRGQCHSDETKKGDPDE